MLNTTEFKLYIEEQLCHFRSEWGRAEGEGGAHATENGKRCVWGEEGRQPHLCLRLVLSRI